MSPSTPSSPSSPPAAAVAPREPRSGTLVRYAAGSIGTGGFATLPGLVLVYFLTDTLGVAAIAAGLLVTVAKVWDVIIDPVIGARSDRSLARTGSRRRFMLQRERRISATLRGNVGTFDVKRWNDSPHPQ